MTIHDEGGMRHFYAEWSRRMGRAAYDPFGDAERCRSSLSARRPAAIGGAVDGADDDDIGSWSTARASRSTTGISRPSSTLCDADFRYTITAYSPEIRKEMIWLDHDKAGMQIAVHATCRATTATIRRSRATPPSTRSRSTRRRNRPRWCRRCRCSAPARRRRHRAVRGRPLHRHGEARRRRAEAARSASSGWTRASSASATTFRSEPDGRDARSRSTRAIAPSTSRPQPARRSSTRACAAGSACPTNAPPAPAAPARRGCVDGDVSTTPGPRRPAASISSQRGEFLMCQCEARSDVTIEVASFVSRWTPAPAFRWSGLARIERTERSHHDVMRLLVDARDAVRIRRRPVRAVRCPASPAIAAIRWPTSTAARTRLDFVIKKKPGGGALRMAVRGHRAAASQVDWFGPLGSGDVLSEIGKNILCIAGGSGIAGMHVDPARARQDALLCRPSRRRFFGVRTAADGFLLDELSGLAARCGEQLQITVALSQEPMPAAAPTTATWRRLGTSATRPPPRAGRCCSHR